jgi:putative acetyltransferase
MSDLAAKIEIRSEIPNDVCVISQLTKRAFADKSFSDGDEQDMIEALRDCGALTISLVAVLNDQIVGHVAFSPAIARDGSEGWFALGPIAVEPPLQRRGIGGALIREGVNRLAALGSRGCILIGDTRYYPRHGFIPRPDLCPDGEPAEAYMILPLNGYLPNTSVAFHSIFHGLGNKE